MEKEMGNEKQMPCARLVRQLNIKRKICGGQCILDFPDGYPTGVSVTDDWNHAVLQLLKFIELTGDISINPLPEDEASYLDFHEVFNNILVRQLNIHRKIIGGQCIMDFPDGYPPGVSVTDDWNLVILQLLKFIEVIGSVSNNPLPEDEATYLDFHEVFNNMYVFIGSLKLVVDQSFYMTEYLTKSLSVLSTLDYVGKTSYCISKKLRSRSIGKDVVQYSHQSIRVDPQTRQPLEFPSFWREKYRKYAAGLPFIMKKITRPQICVLDFLYRIQTCDIDDQNHTNNRAYVRLCMECSKRGAVERRYKCFSSVLFENGIKELQVRFENEALLGEEVIVYVWEATGRTDQLCFEIVKGLDVCIQATMTFYATPINYSTSGMNKSRL